jgi:hypothetical protein
VPVHPSNEDPILTEAQELTEALTGFGNDTIDMTLARIARARAAQIFQWENAVMAVVPHDPDRIATDLIEGFDDGSL